MGVLRNGRRSAGSWMWTALLLGVATGLGACGDSVSGPQAESCGPGPYFSALPIAEIDLDVVSVFGGLGAPGHTLPTPHGGMFATRVGVPLRSPGALAVTELRRVRYVVSPTRQGVEDYAIFFQVCDELTGWFGHVTSLAPTFSPQSIDWDDCETYSTSDETVQACTVDGQDIRFGPGDALGTGGAGPGFLYGPEVLGPPTSWFLSLTSGARSGSSAGITRSVHPLVMPIRRPGASVRASFPWSVEGL